MTNIVINNECPIESIFEFSWVENRIANRKFA